MGGKNHMVDYLSDDEGGGTLLAPQTPAPDWSIGGTFDHPPSDSGGEAEEAAPASPACAVCFSASHGPLVYTERAPMPHFRCSIFCLWVIQCAHALCERFLGGSLALYRYI